MSFYYDRDLLALICVHPGLMDQPARVLRTIIFQDTARSLFSSSHLCIQKAA